jgi:hypothetical protein
MKNIIINARRWFDHNDGNTYHSSDIFVDGEPIEGVKFAYGYGDHYEETAMEKLIEQHFITDRDRHEALWRWCERNGVKLHRTVIDVSRKRDL